MARTRRRPYPIPFSENQRELTLSKYGKRGNARGKHTDKHTGGHGDLPNKPRGKR